MRQHRPTPVRSRTPSTFDFFNQRSGAKALGVALHFDQPPAKAARNTTRAANGRSLRHLDATHSGATFVHGTSSTGYQQPWASFAAGPVP